jgi:hypothetical protein
LGKASASAIVHLQTNSPQPALPTTHSTANLRRLRSFHVRSKSSCNFIAFKVLWKTPRLSMHAFCGLHSQLLLSRRRPPCGSAGRKPRCGAICSLQRLGCKRERDHRRQVPWNPFLTGPTSTLPTGPTSTALLLARHRQARLSQPRYAP